MRWSTGKGNWARVPWLAVLNERETTTTQRGLYVVFLFRENMTGVYLTLNQGVTEIVNEHGRTRGRTLLRERADKYGALAPELITAGFRIDAHIDLRTEAQLGTDYEFSTIAYKLYEAGQVPPDAQIEADLAAVLLAYDRMLSPQQVGRRWIFQANPELYDIDGALRELPEFSWLVKQHADAIRANDRVYLWRSGRRAGIIGEAQILGDPAEFEEADAEARFNVDQSKFQGPRLRVKLRVLRRVDPPVYRDRILQEPRLQELSILRAPQATNFVVTSEQASVLDELITDTLARARQPQAERRVWLIAPGKDAEHWEEFYRQGIIAIGWNSLGDLSQYNEMEELAQRISTDLDRESPATNDARCCYEFAHVMAPGDVVFVKRGRSAIIGYGVITGSFVYDASRPTYRNTRTVRWERRGQWAYDGRFPLKTLTDISDNQELVTALETLIEDQEDAHTPPTPPIERVPYTIEDALDGLFLSRAEFDHALNLIRSKKNVILQGAPGVGKTFVAKRLAYSLMGFKDDSRIGFIQFHQSYSYEDFIQGYRPTSIGFVLKNGLFYEFCRRAAKDPDNAYVFIIDEINRGNLGKVFGELMMLIEADKRGPKWSVPLTYAESAETQFFVPENVHLLGMMNTADRSLSMVDYALRRRFGFVTLHSKIESPEFRSHLLALGAPPNIVGALTARMGELNRAIAEDKSNLGPGYCIGHSFFCNPFGGTPDEIWYRQIIETEVLPLLEEYWFDYPDRVEQWRKRLVTIV